MTCLAKKPKTLAIDIETYSSVDLGDAGVYKYSESPDFEILLFAYGVDDEPVKCIDLTRERFPERLKAWLEDPEILKTAFNAQFERVCLNKYTGDITGPWECTMIRAWQAGYAGGLATVGKMLGLPPDERKTNGKALIRTFCKPRKPTKNNPATRWYPEDKPKEWQTFIDYNIRDVVAERAIRNKVVSFPILEAETRLYRLDQQINDRGIRIDVEVASGAVAINDTLTERTESRYLDITQVSNVNSLPQLKAWLKERTGDDVGSVTKDTVPRLVEKYADYPDVVEVLNIRAQLGKTSITKYSKMLLTRCDDNRSRGCLQFFGAKTGRWAGRLVQLQNLPQNHLPDLDTARAAIKTGDLDVIGMVYDDPTDVLRQCIRTAIIPADGCKFVVADFSAIEARVIAWLAGEKWRSKVFAEGGDIYCASASQMFGVPVVKHGINGHLRQKGKVAELALGYAGSVGALKAMGALRMGIPEEELRPIVNKWRAASPKIVKLWHEIEDAVVKVIEDHDAVGYVGPYISTFWDRGILFIKLPSGRRMGYVNARIEDVGKKSNIVYDDVSNGQLVSVETYYGKLTENIVQATARDCLAHVMLKLEDAGFRIIFHVHDEVIIEIDKEYEALEYVCELMGEPIPWAPGLLLRADGYECDYYQKD